MPAPSPFLPATARQPHLIIAFAVCSADAWLPTMKTLPPASTRKLGALLRGMKLVPATAPGANDAHSLSPPHERAWALAQGLITAETPDGLIPWAAQDAVEHLQAEGNKAWAWVTPCHWAMGREHATLTDPSALSLREDESRALLAAMQPYFETDGITLHYLRPERWLAEGEVFRTLPTASLDRVLGRNVDGWLPNASIARHIRRLQNEMQMLLYTHPINDQRAFRRQLPVNSFWLSGTGALRASSEPSASFEISLPRKLAQALFNDDWAAYAQAWAAIDADEVAGLLARQRAGESVRLTLCGERASETYASSRPGLLAKTRNLFTSLGVLSIKPIYNGREQL